MLRGDFHAASRPTTFTSPRRELMVTANFARDGNIEIALDRMIACALCHGVDRNQPTDGCDRGLSFFVVLVGVFLILRTYALADNDGDLVVVGSMNADGAARVNDFQAGSRRESLASR